MIFCTQVASDELILVPPNSFNPLCFLVQSDPLWTARLLHTNPDVIRDIHLSYLNAGASIIITASYQVLLMCACLYVHVGMCVCAHACTYMIGVCVCVRMLVRTCRYVCVCPCLYVHDRCVCVCAHACTYM